MFGFTKKPTTVAEAISGLVKAVNDLEAVHEAQFQIVMDKKLEADLAVAAGEAAKREAGHAASVARKLREITEPKEAE